MLNHITIMGRLTRDPELRRTGSNVPVASFTLAVDRDFPDKQTGERETDFIDCVAWRQTGEFAAKYFTKGRMAVVSGRLQIRTWEDKDNNKRRSAEVVVDNMYFADSKKEGDNSSANAPSSDPGYAMPDPGMANPGSYTAPPSGYNGPNSGYGAPSGGYNYGGGYGGNEPF